MQIQIFHLLHVAGVLTGVEIARCYDATDYGTAWFDKKDFEELLRGSEEAKERDHRKLIKSLTP